MIGRLAQALPAGSDLPDPELSAHMLSAYADEAARLTLNGYSVERILDLTRWALKRLRVARRALRAIRVDWALLRRRRDLRLMLSGYTVSLLGGEFTQVALAVQVYALTHSSLKVGLLGAAEFIPVVALALIGGAMADAFDRRKLIWGAELAAAFVSAALLVNALLPHPQLWLLYVAAALFAAASTVLRPPLDALMPRLVERDELKVASALESAIAGLALVAGPALAGVVIAAASVGTAYAIDVASFGASLTAFALHAHAPAAARRRAAVAEGHRRGPQVRRLAPGAARLLRDRHGRDVLRDPVRAVPGVRRALRRDRGRRPALRGARGGRDRRHAHERLGRARAIATARRSCSRPAAGAPASRSSGWPTALWLALLFLAVAGGFDAISGIFRGALWNETIPDRLRGRLAGVEMISWSSGPLLGNVRAGASAGWFGLGASVVIGGVLCIGTSLALAAALPRFWRYRS